MKIWALIVAALYGMILVLLAAPMIVAAFPETSFSSAMRVYSDWQFWMLVGVMVLGQVMLLTIPVRVASRRPIRQRSLILPVLFSGLLMGALVIAALISLLEWRNQGNGSDNIYWGILGTGLATWIVWGTIFFLMGRARGPEKAFTRMCTAILSGSILELLVAVPTHIVVRHRHYCCAGLMTFTGLTLGLSVMLFSFGPAVFFLYAQRWQKLRPASSSAE